MFFSMEYAIINSIKNAESIYFRLQSTSKKRNDYEKNTYTYFGDIGQDAFTEEQLTALGSVDVAFMQLDNPFSNMDTTNKKAVNLMAQPNPLVIIPTHVFSVEAIQMAIEIWTAVYTDQPSVTISPSDFPEETHILFMGSMTGGKPEDFDLPKAVW